MTQYFYMRPVYGWPDPPGQRICASWAHRGSITTDPYEAYKRYQLKHERRMHEKHGIHVDRRGVMFAYWRLERKMPWHEALPIAQTTQPERVCLLVGVARQWAKVDFVLPPGELIEVGQYPAMLPKAKRST